MYGIHIEKFVKSHVFPRYAVGAYGSKSRYPKEYYENARKVARAKPFTSDDFVNEVLTVANVVAFPINTTKVHPKCEEIQKLSEEIVSLCNENGLEGLMYIRTGGTSVGSKEISLLREEFPEAAEYTSIYTLYCENTRVESTPLAYGFDGVTTKFCNNMRKKVAKLVMLVSEVGWLPRNRWKAIILPGRESSFSVPIVMGKNMFEYFLGCKNDFISPSGSNYKDIPFCDNRYIESVNRYGVSPKFTPVSSSRGVYDIVNTVKKRRQSVFCTLFGDPTVGKKPMELLDVITEECEKIDLGDRYIVDFAASATSKKRTKWASDAIRDADLRYAGRYWDLNFWADLAEEVKINAFPIDSEQAHPDYKMIRELCSKITKELSESCEIYEVGRFWYLIPVLKPNWSFGDDVDSVEFALYCNDNYKGFVKPSYCYDGENHSELEVDIAKLLYIVTSVPWLDLKLWGCLALPCSGYIRSTYGEIPAVLGRNSMFILKGRSRYIRTF